MHERPGPQYNRGNDPTTGVCILKNATQKKWYLRFWNIFSFILRWRAESPVVFSGVSRGGGGRVRCPLSFRPKRGPKGREKFFFETGPPLYLRIWMTPPPIFEGLEPPLVLLSRKEKWRLCLNRVEPLFQVVGACSSNLRTYLSWSLKNVPLPGGASVYRPLQGGGTPRVSDQNGAKSIPLPGVGEPKLAKSS